MRRYRIAAALIVIGMISLNNVASALSEVPSTAILVSPINEISDTTPTYTWNAVSDSTWYYLWVNNDTGTALKKWYRASETGCETGAGICSITPLVTLNVGNSIFWIRTWNEDGFGDWSDGMEFSVSSSNLNNPPSTAMLVSPNSSTSNAVTYVWNAVSNATWYFLWVDDSEGTAVKKWYTAAEAGCESGTGDCSVTSSTTIETGNGKWWIRTWNDDGFGEWSSEMNFTVESGNTMLPSGQIWTDPTNGMEFVYVESGCYEMGCGNWTDECYDDESPAHTVCVDSFWISRYEVTIDEYRQFLLAGGDDSGVDFADSDCPINDDITYSLRGNKFGSDGDQPMVDVSWYGAKAMVEWLSGETGYAFSLPTEAQWEYAARSGGQEEKYSGGDDVDTVAWYGANSGSTTHKVGTKAPNGFGIYDMSGNAGEWCSDWYERNYYSNSPTNNPQGASSGTERVNRGGGWEYSSRLCRTVLRYGGRPDDTDLNIGFRPVISPWQ